MDSQNVGIYVVEDLARFSEIKLCNILRRMALLPYKEKFVAITLLHINNNELQSECI